MKTICLIPLRIGSKSIPKKNIKEFNGKPLCFWYINEVSKSKEIEEIIIASDSDEINDIILNYEYDKKISFYDRDSKNALDSSSTEDLLLEFIKFTKIKKDTILVLGQVTSPIIDFNQIDKGIKMIKQQKYDSVLSVVKQKRFIWSNDGKPKNYDFNKRPRRQNFIGFLVENGAFYISRVNDILKSKCRISGKIGLIHMPDYAYHEIDEDYDWDIVEKLHKRFNNKKQEGNPKLIISDIDGVLTDSGMYYSEKGDEQKKFNTKDGMAFSLFRDKGLISALITSETTKINLNRSKKMNIDYLFQGRKNETKKSAIIEICSREKISLNDVIYVGDDINCIDSLTSVGFPFCPNDAVEAVKKIKDIEVLQSKGGEGCIREIYEFFYYNV